jgi:hypothetical protein
VRRLLYYFKPSNNKFSTTELSSELHRRIVVVGLHFVELLATSDSVRSWAVLRVSLLVCKFSYTNQIDVYISHISHSTGCIQLRI